MKLRRYEFDSIFAYDPTNGILIPKYTVVVGNKIYRKNQAMTHDSVEGGLNLFHYIGKGLVATWNPKTEILDVEGICD